MSVQHKKNFTKLDNQDHILVKKGLAAVARRFLETREVRLKVEKVFFLFIRIFQKCNLFRNRPTTGLPLSCGIERDSGVR